ncbi:hypothetical protein EW146_g1995 [Bondarzewia mesenterica]|uniref:Uncharacterized protein n=1 Tax=Bondarzewia mesenterica TaxID=1095465 RepID=A0A4S4M272_9AGAM|nr:hypothetical protein EW146_g1995 [Bondarzewia mesenterica]
MDKNNHGVCDATAMPLVNHRATSAVSERFGIQVRLREMEDERLRLLRRWNDLAPISRLPPEILSMMFRMCACDDRTFRSPPAIRRSILLSHVCTRWRAVAVDDPRLWTSYFLPSPKSNPSLVWKCLARSKTMPITVKLDFPQTTPPNSSDTIKEGWQALYHLSHICDLCIACTDMVLATYSFYLETTPAPFLERLAVWCLEEEPTLIPGRRLFCDWAATPSLRDVQLYGCLVDSFHPMLRRLTSLSLDRCTYRFQDLLDALSNAPQLQSFGLSSEDPPRSDLTMYLNRPVVHMPHLRKLTLMDFPVIVRALLESLSFPPSLVLNICDEVDPSETPSRLSHIPAVVAAVAATEPLQSVMVRSTEYVGGKATAFVVSGSRTDLDYFSPYRDDDTGADIFLSFWRPWKNVDYRPEVLAEFCFHMSLDQVQSLTICDQYPMGWGALFSRFPNVQRLRLVGLGQVETILDLLTPAAQAVQSDSVMAGSSQPMEREARTLLPNLTVVRLSGVWDGKFDEEDADDLLQSIEQFLSVRQARGAKIVELKLDGPQFSEDFDRLAPYVGGLERNS